MKKILLIILALITVSISVVAQTNDTADRARRRWWVSMSPLMPSHADHRPVSRDLTEVFRLDRVR